ncbi:MULTISPECIES: hypothetical protein [unclassified Lentimonas]|uniref:hypothetical protein n=1 Tax=unclassified Lentimonas TaxID=2630993 RepID=UPI001321FE22|nr:MULTISPECIES: hypothetical protein [unclassified Lentimonas]CAA6676571.1 Unannotated [Lentimonas sp. CC4]CAA6684765.1 Unannotated [Lentimonas sp. CC6]CAA7075401.1 Unannotated [Lentimonas sp. CC4]CAA7168936.1 Unannotated [Lentimonas sp. CC21]CAA7182190.1 Unannotated [Lentimonas sp. CC8]
MTAENPESNSQDTSPQKVDVVDILKANLRVQQDNEAPLDLQPRKSRKKRDYWLCLALVNVGLLIPFFVLEKNVVTATFSLAAMILFSAGFSWIMWQVVDDY